MTISEAPSAYKKPGRKKVISISLLMAGVILLNWALLAIEWKSGTSVMNIRYDWVTYTFEYQGATLLNYLRFLDYVVFLLICIFGKNEKGGKLFSPVVQIAFVVLPMLCAFWLLYDFQNFIAHPTALLEPTSPLNLFVVFGVMAGARASIWRWVNSAFVLIAFGSAFISLLYVHKLDVYARYTNGSPLLFHLIFAFWTGAYSLLRLPPENIRRQIIFTIPLLLCLYIAIFAQARGWTVQCLLVIGLRYTYLNTRRTAKSLSPFFISCLLFLLILGGGAFYLLTTESQAVTGIMDRLSEDTRSFQYEAFFRQVPLSGLLTGLGSSAGYDFDDISNYQFLDNQILFIMFKFGLLAAVCYVVILFSAIPRVLVLKVPREEKAAALVLLLWIIALLGLSTFLTIRPDVTNFLIAMLAGRCFWLIRKNRNERKIRFQTKSQRQETPTLAQIEPA